MNISLKNAIKSWLWNPLFSHFFLFHWDRQMAVLFTETELLSDVLLYCCLRAVLPDSLETCVLDLLLASSAHHWAECLNPVYQILHHKCCLFLEKKQSVVVTLIIFWDRRSAGFWFMLWPSINLQTWKMKPTQKCQKHTVEEMNEGIHYLILCWRVFSLLKRNE